MNHKMPPLQKGFIMTEDTYELRAEKAKSLLKEGENIQEKIAALLATLHGGVFWTPQHQQQLSTLLALRKKHAQELGMLLITNKETFFMQSLFEEKSTEQLTLFEDRVTPMDWLLGILQRLDPPTLEESYDIIHKEFHALDSILQGIFSWSVQPADFQTGLLEHIVARLRHIQCGTHAHLFEEQIRRLFYKMTDYSKRHTPGFIHGMSLNHKPREENWFEDAMDTWQKLQKKTAQSSLDVLSPLYNILYAEEDTLTQMISWDQVEIELLKIKQEWGSPNLKRMLIKHLNTIAKRPALQELCKLLMA